MEYQDNTDYEELVSLSLKEILRHEDFHLFLAWMRKYLGVSPQLSLLSGPSDYLGPMATSLALAIWNCTPLPGNGFKTKAIRLPGRFVAKMSFLTSLLEIPCLNSWNPLLRIRKWLPA